MLREGGEAFEHLTEVTEALQSIETAASALRRQLAHLARTGQAGSDLGRSLSREADFLEDTARGLSDTLEHVRQVADR